MDVHSTVSQYLIAHILENIKKNYDLDRADKHRCLIFLIVCGRSWTL